MISRSGLRLKWFLPLFLVALFATSVAAQTSPLIMKHADSLAVARKRGTLLLQGRVHFIHDVLFGTRTMKACNVAVGSCLRTPRATLRR